MSTTLINNTLIHRRVTVREPIGLPVLGQIVGDFPWGMGWDGGLLKAPQILGPGHEVPAVRFYLQKTCR
jgi:hypothetical protein